MSGSTRTIRLNIAALNKRTIACLLSDKYDRLDVDTGKT
jgi:hypothetical protein